MRKCSVLTIVICFLTVIQTPARGGEKEEFIKLADHLSFYRLVAITCGWTKTPSFDAVDQLIAKVKPSEYAAGRESAEQSMADLLKITKGNTQAGCLGMRDTFDRFGKEADLLQEQFKSRGFL